MDDASSAWSYIFGGGFVGLLVTLGAGIKFIVENRKGNRTALEGQRDAVLEDYKEIADKAREELNITKQQAEAQRLAGLAELATERASRAAEIVALKAAHAGELLAVKASMQRERAFSLYHLALADFWHGRARWLWHMCTNWEQYSYSVVFLLRAHVLKNPEAFPPGTGALLDKTPERALEPPPFQTPNEAIAQMRPPELST